jgi:hypothetical protein
MEHRVIRDILASLRRLVRALGRSDFGRWWEDATYRVYVLEAGHVAIGACLGAVARETWPWVLTGLAVAVWAVVQGRQWWSERDLPAQGWRLADLRGDTLVVGGAFLAVVWLPLWLAGPLALAGGVVRASLRDADQWRRAEGDEWSWM